MLAEELEDLIGEHDLPVEVSKKMETAWCLLKQIGGGPHEHGWIDDLIYYYGLEGLHDCKRDAIKWQERYMAGEWGE